MEASSPIAARTEPAELLLIPGGHRLQPPPRWHGVSHDGLEAAANVMTPRWPTPPCQLLRPRHRDLGRLLPRPARVHRKVPHAAAGHTPVHAELCLDGRTSGWPRSNRCRGARRDCRTGPPTAEVVVRANDVDAQLAALSAKGDRALSPAHDFPASLRRPKSLTLRTIPCKSSCGVRAPPQRPEPYGSDSCE
jgi:hypothetical protein